MHKVQKQQQERTPIMTCLLSLLTTFLFLATTAIASTNHHPRHLEIGDFDQLNQLFQSVQLLLPDTTVSESGLTLNVQNLVCTNIVIGDIQTNYTISPNDDLLAINIFANPISITCSADYTFEIFLVNGEGRFTATSETSSTETQLSIQSNNTFSISPPTTATTGYCNTQINTNGQISFDGATYEPLLNLFKQLISNLVDQYASEAVCDIITDSGPNLFNNLFNQTNEQFDTWINIPNNVSLTDPLFTEETYVALLQDDTALIDFQSTTATNESSSVTGLMVRLLKEVDTLFGISNDDVGDLGINAFIRNQLIDADSGAWNIDVASLLPNWNSLLFESTNNNFLQSSIYIRGAKIVGLDTLQTFQPFMDIGSYTLSNVFRWEKLALDLAFTIDIKPSTQPDSILIHSDTAASISEDFTIRVDFTDVAIDLALFMAIEQTKFENLSIGSLLSTGTILPCLLSTLNAIDVSGLNVSFTEIGSPTIDGFASPGINRIVSQLTEAFYRMYKPTILRTIPGIFQGPVRTMLTEFLNSPDNRSCNSLIGQETSNEEIFVDFRDLLLSPNDSIELGGSGASQYGNLIRSLVPIVKDELFSTDPETGLSRINAELIADITKQQSGVSGNLYFPNDLFNTEKRIQAGGLDANVQLRAYGIYLNNLDTISTPTLLQPVKDESTHLYNNIEIGTNRSVQLGFRLLFGLLNEDSNIENELEISLDMTSVQIFLTALAKVSEKALTLFPIRDLTNFDCWLATIPAPNLDSRGVRVNEDDEFLSVTEFIATIADLALNISCVNCSGPRMVELAELVSSEKGSNAVTDLANELFDLIPKLVEGNFFQLAIDRTLNDASRRCPHSPAFDPNFSATKFDEFTAIANQSSSSSFFVALLIVCGILAVIVLFTILATRLIVRRRHYKWISSIPKKQVIRLWKQQEEENESKRSINESTQSIFRSTEVVPFWIRLTMPVIILANIGFFLSGHLSLAASVTIIGSLGGQTFSEEGFFEFSMAKSTIEIWNAGGQELAILIFIFSFAWPYAKTLLTLALWFVPPTTLSVEHRGSILLWLDFLAKWSTIDIFVLIVTIVSFRVSVQSPEIDFLPSDFYSLDLLVAPKWGLYANLTAQIISQLSSHYIIHYHRRIVEVARNKSKEVPDIVQTNTTIVDTDGNELEIGMPSIKNVQAMDTNLMDGRKDRLLSHAYKRPHRGDTERLVTKRIVNPLLVLLAVCCVALVILGCILPSYSVNSLGVVGVLVESGQKFAAAGTSYSVFTTIALLFNQAKLTGTATDFLGLGSLSFIMLLSVLLVPIAQTLTLLVQWFAPLTHMRRRRLMVLLEVLQAWQYAEVYLLAIIVGSWQLGPISEFMINPYCASLKGFFTEMVYYGILKEEDAQCFRTDMKVEPTFYLLFVGAIILTLINSFVTKAVTQYLRDISSSSMPQYNDLESKLDVVEDGGVIDANTDEQASKIRGKIHPVPVLFSDRYRWFLQRHHVLSYSSSPQSSIVDSESQESSGS